MGAYLSKRIIGSDIEEALAFAAAAVSLKIETPGPLRYSHNEIINYMN